LPEPSIPKSMNVGLRAAMQPLVLFLDDDIVPSDALIESHKRAHAANPSLWATVGQVIQPWQQPKDLKAPRKCVGLKTDFDFPFNSTVDQYVSNVMAGNLCVHRQRALSIGGFDENFQGSAYRFETEFARRIATAGGSIQFLGSAGIQHLRVPSGGTRKDGSHLTSASPLHGIGDHYYAFLHGGPVEKWMYSVRRAFREVYTKFHLTHPWWIPVKMIGELRAMWGGWRMAGRKRREDRGARREGG
jgi:GT2 family glycosyltransferase